MIISSDIYKKREKFRINNNNVDRPRDPHRLPWGLCLLGGEKN